ncbi:MAG: hypothetical protein H6Q73_2847 [Firmicutes bacterium]|nr:hypothetical protein [Bacillota bacterium]
MDDAPRNENLTSQDSADSNIYTDPSIIAKIARLEQYGIRPAITVYKEAGELAES